MDQARPKVSIIIPTYNRPNLLRKAIKSVLNQSYQNIEVIVVDDHSDTDLDMLKKEFPTVQFFQNEKNSGPCFSRNRGLEESKGVYINFLDDDDELYPEKISKQIEKFQTSNLSDLGFVTAHVLDMRSGEEIIKKNNVHGNIYRDLLSGYAISGNETLLIKKDCLMEVGGFDENLQSSQEYDLMIRLAEKYQVDFVDDILSRENRSIDQISLNFDKKISGAKHLFQKHNKRYRDQGIFFWLKMQVKLYGLIGRYLIGTWFGEKTYRLTIRN